MRKYYWLLYWAAGLLVLGFGIQTFVDYMRYNEFNSAPFSLWIWVNSILYLLPAAICLIIGLIMKKKNSVNSAKWHGKLNTVIIYSVIVVLIMFPQIPENIVNIMGVGCITMMSVSFVLYAKMFLDSLKK